MKKASDWNLKDLKKVSDPSKVPKTGMDNPIDQPKEKLVKRALVANEPELTSNHVFLNKQFLKAYLKCDLE